MMPEIDHAAGEGSEAASALEGRDPSEGVDSFLLDEQDLAVLEGLAHEDPETPTPPADRAPAPCPLPPPTAANRPSMIESLAALGEDLGRRIDALRSTFERELARRPAASESLTDFMPSSRITSKTCC